MLLVTEISKYLQTVWG